MTVASTAVHWSVPVEPGLQRLAEDLADRYPESGVAAQDLTGALVGATESAASLLGLTLDQMLGRTSMDPRWSAVSERGLPLVGGEHPAMVTLATGRPGTGFLMGVMTPLDVDDIGRTVARTRWIDIDSHPAWSDEDSGGSTATSVEDLIGVVAVFEDATDTARGRAASDAQWATLHLVLQNTEDVLLRTVADGVIRWVSLAVDRVLGWHPGELVGMSMDDLAHPDDREALRRLQQDLRDERTIDGVGRVDIRLRSSDGSWRWIADSARLLHDRDMAVSGEVHALRDIEVEVAARRALAQSEEHYRLIAENATDVILHVRGDTVVWISPSVSQVLGGGSDDWVGRSVLDHIVPEDRYLAESTRARLADTLTDNGTTLVRFRVLDAEGRVRWVDANARQYVTADGSVDGVMASLRVVDDLVRAEAALERQARMDALTGLANRAEAMRVIGGVVGGDRRTGVETAVLFCDIDHLKEVNDSQGHQAGDEVLRLVSDRVRATLRQGDFVARIGGDELLVILRGLTGVSEALAVAEKVRLAVCQPVALPHGSADVSVSIGVTLAVAGDTGDTLVERADSAMYEAKRTGRNQVVVWAG